MMGPHWYVSHNGHRLGPFAAPDLKQLALAGLLQPADLVWTVGLREWVEASRFPVLFAPSTATRYWLSVGGEARGPFSIEQVRLSLAARQVSPETLACPEGGTEWTPLKQFADFSGPAPAPRSSHARLLGSMDAEEAAMYLAGKGGDALARLISTLLEMKKTYADNTALVESLERSIQVLKARREAAIGK